MNYQRGGILGSIPKVVLFILVTNIILYLAIHVSPWSDVIYQKLSLFYFKSDSFFPTQLLTYMFMHDPNSLSHIGFNMFALFMFGRVLETFWDSKKFFIFYFVCGIGAALVQLLTLYIFDLYYIAHANENLFHDLSPELVSEIKNNGFRILLDSMNYSDINVGNINRLYYEDRLSLYLTPMVGASGAIFGLIMAYGMTFPDQRLMLLFPPIPIKAKYVAVLALVMGIALDYKGNVAHFAHFGGMIFGFILIKLWKRKQFNNF